MDEVYLAGDVDSIKDYVFETSSLPQIRGGSELLQRCEEHIKGRYGDRVIYCAGGAFLLKAARDAAPAIKQEIEQLYRDQTLVVTVTVVHEQGGFTTAALPSLEGLDGWALRLARASERSYWAGEFPLRIAHLMARLREVKRSPQTSPFYQAFPFGLRCNRCGKRMVVRLDPTKDDRLCPVCDLRDGEGRQRQKDVHGRTVRGKFNQEFWQRYGANFHAQQPEDLDILVREAPRSYLAFLYADGNDIGRLLGQARSEEDYRALSAALTKGTREAVYSALAATCGRALQQQQWWPFDIVNIGGDDVTLLLQAGYAWQVAIEFLERFEQGVRSRAAEALLKVGADSPQSITASCAIVVADVKFPVRHMERLASDLLKQAKDAAKRAGESQPASALTFLWLPAPIASDAARPLLSTYEFRRDTEAVSLLARPYTLHQAKEILALSVELARWPRSLRHRWREALARGPLLSTSLIAYDLARRRQGQRQTMLRALEQLANLLPASAASGPQLWPPVWTQERSSSTGIPLWRTALLDALELAELHSLRPGWREEAEE
jgi:hypothetical protein